MNFPSQELTPAVMRLIGTTGSKTLAMAHQHRGLRYVRAKFAEANLTPCRSTAIVTAGVEECPIRLEAELIDVHPLPDPRLTAVEMRILRINADTSIVRTGTESEIDVEKWQPLRSAEREVYFAPCGGLLAMDPIRDHDGGTPHAVVVLSEPRKKIKASRAGRGIVAASPSVTSLRAVFEGCGVR
ncbi:MAG: hypothetical protein L6R40_003420 [Gallowayella cf. fulva]|nr:MAG: hypothetical protein L6R40_003420 [Xanthomendoza cf. fulva]